MINGNQRWRNMHRVIAGFLKTFCEETFVDAAMEEDKRFELFSNYCMIKSFYPEEIDASTITSEEDDSGIDGICFIIFMLRRAQGVGRRGPRLRDKSLKNPMIWARQKTKAPTPQRGACRF